MITVGILRCNVCGAPMYPNPARQAFCFPFCGNESAYGPQLPRMKYEHKKLEFTEEGYFSLKRVAVLTSLSSVDDDLLAKRKWRTFDELVQLFDRRAFVTNRNRKEFSFGCPACGAPVQGNDLMSMFECQYCGTKYSFEDAAEHGYIKIARIIGYEGMLPKQCLPYEVTAVQAENYIRSLAERSNLEQDGFPVNNLLRQKKMLSIYAPGRLWDRKFLLEVSMNGSLSKLYVEWINWISLCNSLDSETFDRLQPWNFEKAGPLVPEYVEGDVRLMATLNDNDELELRQALLKKRLTEEISEAYDVREPRILKWGNDFIKHKNGTIAMPVYYLEYRDMQNRRCVNVMVNGQTGKTVASVSVNGKERYCELIPGKFTDMTGECSMHAKPVKVKYVKPSFLYEAIR